MPWLETNTRDYTMKHILRTLVPLMLLLAPLAAQAQIVPPTGARIATVPGYNQVIGIWATDTPVGGYVALYMQNGGVWSGCGDCYIAPSAPDFNFDATVVGAGGAEAYVRNVVVPSANAVLARKFPPGGTGGGTAPPGSDASVLIDYFLGSNCSLQNVNGAETLSCR